MRRLVPVVAPTSTETLLPPGRVRGSTCSICKVPGFRARTCPFASPLEQGASMRAAVLWQTSKLSMYAAARETGTHTTALIASFESLSAHRARTAQLVAGMRAVDSVRKSK